MATGSVGNVIVSTIRVTAGTQQVSLGPGMWDVAFFFRGTALTVTVAALGLDNATSVENIPTQVVDAGADGVITDGALVLSGNTIFRLCSVGSNAISTSQLAAINPYVTVIRDLLITVASPTSAVELTMVASKLNN